MKGPFQPDLFGLPELVTSSRRAERRTKVLVTEETERQVVALVRAGRQMCDIAAAFGVSQGTIRRQFRTALDAGRGGLSAAGRPEWHVTRLIRRRVEALRAAGVGEGAIASDLGISLPTLRKHLPANGVRG